MKEKDHNTTYALDHSAMVHLAARRKKHTNLFRIEMTLKETVDHKILQKALAHITRRFPSVIAGIREGFWNYHIVPVRGIPAVRKEQACLQVMSEEEIQNCAFRVLYRENHIAVEFFHSLTDGHGGMAVTATLVAEYLRLKYGINIPDSEFVLGKGESIPEETTDDYLRFAGKKGTVSRYLSSFQLPERSETKQVVQRTCYEYAVPEVLRLAHSHGVSITALLLTVMMKSVMEIQKKEPDKKRPVQIMIPVDLRRLFGSTTLRNFSLFAVCGIETQNENLSFEQLLQMMEVQLRSQNTAEFMEKTIAGQLKVTQSLLYRCLPLTVKMKVLRLVQEICGERNSCISISNLGVVSFPEPMEEQVENVSFTLSPRRKSLHNCSVVSYKGKLSVMFSRSCEETELESIFAKRMKTIL